MFLQHLTKLALRSAFVLCMLSLLPASSFAASIFGTVRDANGNTVSGATLTLSGDASSTTTTDAQGEYSFPNLGVGSYTVELSIAGQELSLPYRIGSIPDPNISLLFNFDAYNSVAGTVTYNEAPRSGTTVRLQIVNTDLSVEVSSGADGRYTIPNLVAGNTYRISAQGGSGSYSLTPNTFIVSFGSNANGETETVDMEYYLLDLTAAVFARPKRARAGSNITLTYSPNHISRFPSGVVNDFTVQVYLSRNRSFEEGRDILLDEKVIQGFDDNEDDQEFLSQIEFPDNVRPGRYYLIAVADSANDIEEENEENNINSTSSRERVVVAKSKKKKKNKKGKKKKKKKKKRR